jgi:hypothetical protein
LKILTAGAALELIAAYEIVGKLGSAVELALRVKNQAIDGRVALGLIRAGVNDRLAPQSVLE